MKQVVLNKPGKLEFKKRKIPKLTKSNELLIEIKKIGICGSDIHAFKGEHPAVVYPVVQGHEYSGIVKAIGEDVKGILPGDKVTARPQLTCGKCKNCVNGRYNICKNLKVEGFQADGAAQEFFKVSSERVIKIPENISLDEGALIEPISVAVHATSRVTLKNKNVVVSGVGPIGNLIAQYSKLEGAKKVLVTDINDYRLSIAKKCGLLNAANVEEKPLEEAVRDNFGDEGFDVAFEAAGVEKSLGALIENINNGSDIIIIGVFAKKPTIDMYYLGEHELKLIGSLMYLHGDYLKAVNSIKKRELQLEPLITKHFRFEEFYEAYQYILERKKHMMKVMINL